MVIIMSRSVDGSSGAANAPVNLQIQEVWQIGPRDV